MYYLTFFLVCLFIRILYPNTDERRDVQPNASQLEAVYGHSLIINPSLGMYQEIHPCRTSSTYSVKINTSLPMMRECVTQTAHWK